MSDLGRLEQIGHELCDLYASGELTFPKFQELYLAAELACGVDRETVDHLEMFCPVIQDESWMEWIREHDRERQLLHAA